MTPRDLPIQRQRVGAQIGKGKLARMVHAWNLLDQPGELVQGNV